MNVTVNHPSYGEIVYSESFWTGKKSLTINGTPLQGLSKKEFLFDEKKIIVKGNYLLGASLQIENEEIALSPKVKWYETVLAILPFIFVLTWGNSPDLVAVIPILGGAIGGALGGTFGCISMLLMKRVQLPIHKALVGIGIFGLSIFVNYVVAVVILQAV